MPAFALISPIEHRRRSSAAGFQTRPAAPGSRVEHSVTLSTCQPISGRVCVGGASVAFDIALQLGRPEFSPRRRRLGVLAPPVRVPEAAMHEDRTCGRAWRCRLTWQVAPMQRSDSPSRTALCVTSIRQGSSCPGYRTSSGCLRADDIGHGGSRYVRQPWPADQAALTSGMPSAAFPSSSRPSPRPCIPAAWPTPTPCVRQRWRAACR